MLHMPQRQVTALKKGNETLDTPNMWRITKEHEEIFDQILNHRNTLTIVDAVYHLPPNETPMPDNCYSPSVTARSTPPAIGGSSRRVFAEFLGFVFFCCCCCFGRLPAPSIAAGSRRSLRSIPATRDRGEEPESGCLAAIPCLTGMAAVVRKLPLVVHASYNLPARTRQHLLRSQYYITAIGLRRAR